MTRRIGIVDPLAASGGEAGMDAWRGVVDVVVPGAAVLLAVVLGWAAVERSRIHRRWKRLRDEWRKETAAHVVDWCVAVGTASGLV